MVRSGHHARSYRPYLTALKDAGDFAVNGAFSLPKSIRWSNFTEAWDAGVKNYFWNSVIVTSFKVPAGIIIIVHAILTPLFDLHGIIPAHFGDRRGPGSLRASHEEVLKLLDLMDLKGRIPVHAGAEKALPNEKTPVPSEGSALIIREAMKDDARPLHVAFLGPLTDMASALLEEPAIAERNVRVVWIGGEDWPVGGWEFNLWL